MLVSITETLMAKRLGILKEARDEQEIILQRADRSWQKILKRQKGNYLSI